QQFGSLDAILARTDEVTKKSVRESLQEHRDKALLSRDLVTLRLDVPLPIKVDELPAPLPDPELLRPLFQRLEFTNLLAALASQKSPEPDVEQHYDTVRDAAALDRLIAALTAAERFAIAVETTGSYPRHLQMVGIAFA